MTLQSPVCTQRGWSTASAVYARHILADAGVATIVVLKIAVAGYEGRALVPFLENAPETLQPRAVLVETDVAERWDRL